MKNSLGRFLAVVGAGWVLLGVAAFLYARMKSIPLWAALPVAAAFLIEFPFYISPAFDAPRAWLSTLPRTGAASLIALSALLPWLAYALSSGRWTLPTLAVMVLIAAGVSFWYLILEVSPASDLLFLVVLAAIILLGVFNKVYSPAIPALKGISYLGHIMLIRTAVMSMFVIRGRVPAEFRFLPRTREWIAGAGWFAALLPVAGLAYWSLGLVRLRPHPLPVALAVATFFGILWVVALSEEFFFRGLLQQWLGRWMNSAAAGLVAASLLFGSAHLGFGGRFPNWRFAIVAAIAGCFYGMAWRTTKSIQSGMVTHALTVTIWRVFLQ